MFGKGDRSAAVSKADYYRMRQKLVSIGDGYWIESDRGERVYKALRLRKALSSRMRMARSW